MILNLSLKLAARLQCELSLADKRLSAERRPDAWSGDLFTIRKKGTFVLLMHDVSLFPIIFPLERGMRFPQFVQNFLVNLAFIYGEQGAFIDIQNQTLIAVRRTNRKVISSMNNAISSVIIHEAYRHTEETPFDCSEHIRDLARTPFSAVEGHFPDQRFAELIAKHN